MIGKLFSVDLRSRYPSSTDGRKIVQGVDITISRPPTEVSFVADVGFVVLRVFPTCSQAKRFCRFTGFSRPIAELKDLSIYGFFPTLS